MLCLVEAVSGVGVDSVADAIHGITVAESDLLGTRGGSAGSITTTEVVHEDGVRPVSLDGSVAVVHALIAAEGHVVHVRDLIVREPALANVVSSDVSSAEVDISLASVGAADPGGGSHRAALLEGDELVEVVEIREHLEDKKRKKTSVHKPDYFNVKPTS